MTDMTSNVATHNHAASKRKANKTEFMVYFAIIFLSASPYTT